MVSAIRRLRGKPTDSDRVEEWAARLEDHLIELECLAAQAVADAVEPAFEATPVGAASPPAAPAGSVGPAVGLSAIAERAADVTAQVRSAPAAGPQAAGSAATPPAAVKRAHPMTLTAAFRLLRARQLSAVELVEEHLGRVRQTEELNVFIAVFEKQARHEAMAADRALASGSAGVLAGIPLAIKDLMEMRGYVMTGGSRVFNEAPSSMDAEVVGRLRAAGAEIGRATR